MVCVYFISITFVYGRRDVGNKVCQYMGDLLRDGAADDMLHKDVPRFL